MSLINDMLKNLEQRKVKSVSEKNNVTVGILSVPRLPRVLHRARALQIITGTFVGLLIMLYVYVKERAPIKPLAVVPPAVIVKAPVVDKKTPPALPHTMVKEVAKNTPTLSTLKAMSLDTKGDDTFLYLAMSDETRYQISEKNNHVLITLIETTVSNILPLLSIKNTVIEAYSITEKEHAVTVDIALLKGAALTDTTYIENAGQKLRMTFHKTAVEVPKAPVAPPPRIVRAPTKIIPVVSKKIIAPTEEDKATIEKNRTQQLAKDYQTALMDIEKGRGQAGLARLKAVVTAMPDYHDARVALIIYLLKQGNSFEAEVYLKQGLDSEPQYAPFQLLHVRLLLDKGRLEGALAALSSISVDAKNAVEYYALRGVIYLRLGRFLEAERAYEALIELEPNGGRWWLGLGIASQALGNNNVAVEAYTEARKLGNNDWHIQSYLNKQLHALKE